MTMTTIPTAPIAKRLTTINTLLQRFAALVTEAADLRERIEDATLAMRRREANIALTIHGKSERDRHFRLALIMAEDETLARLRAPAPRLDLVHPDSQCSHPSRAGPRRGRHPGGRPGPGLPALRCLRPPGLGPARPLCARYRDLLPALLLSPQRVQCRHGDVAAHAEQQCGTSRNRKGRRTGPERDERSAHPGAANRPSLIRTSPSLTADPRSQVDAWAPLMLLLLTELR